MGLRNPRIQQLQSLTQQTRQQSEQAASMAGAEVQRQAGAAVTQAAQQGPMGPQQIQQVAGQAVAAKAQAGLQAQQTAATAALQQGEETLKIQEFAANNALQNRQISLEQRKNQLESRLQRISLQNNKTLFDKEMRFRRDELGRTILNEQQLMDWQISKVRNYEEFKNFELKVRQVSERKMKLLEAAENRIRQELKQRWEQGEKRKDHQASVQLQKALHNITLKRAREEAAAKNRFAKMQAFSSILFGTAGAVAGGMAGGPMGAMAGYSGGSALGSGLVTLAN